MAVPWWSQCRRWSTNCTSAGLFETLWHFNSRSVSVFASPVGPTSWKSKPGNEVSLRRHRLVSPVKPLEGHSYRGAVMRLQWMMVLFTQHFLGFTFVTFPRNVTLICLAQEFQVFSKNLSDEWWLVAGSGCWLLHSLLSWHKGQDLLPIAH